MVDLKSEEELRAMPNEQLRKRLNDVMETLRMMRRARKRGLGNPGVYHKIKCEKRLIVKIQRERRLKIKHQEEGKR